MQAAISNDLITGLLSFLFTVLILSYVVGDNPAFRLAIHAFVGVSAGYIAIIVFRQVVVDKLFLPLATGTINERILLAFPLILGLLLLGKMSAKLEGFGRPVVAFLVGIGAAAAVAGAITGTLFPQIQTAVNMFDPRVIASTPNAALGLIAGAFILVGTIATLTYFQFTIRGGPASTGNRGRILSFFALIGQVFIVITLGAIFAGVLSAAITAFVDRIQSIIDFFFLLFFK